jgi:hypothetical protein
VLLISADFLASEFIMNRELPSLLAKAESRGTLIMPLIIHYSRFVHMPSLSRFQAVNPPDLPLATLPTPRREEYFNQLAEAVAAALS